MTGVPSPRVVVDADRVFPEHETHCDYLLFFVAAGADTLVAAPIELKSGEVDASKVAKQLQRGAGFVDGVAPTGPGTVCRPILFHGKRIHPQQRKVLNRAKVRFRGRSLTIKTARCNRPGNLAQALSDRA